MELGIAIAALCVSAASIGVAGMSAWFARNWNIRPTMSFSYKQGTGWMLKNIGRGPSLDLIVGVGADDGIWDHVKRVPPMAVDAEMQLDWVSKHDHRSLICEYRDIYGAVHTTVMRDDTTVLKKGGAEVVWPEEIDRSWEEPVSDGN